MREKKIFRDIKEKVDPSHTAFLIIDMQNDYCSADGEAAKAGRPRERYQAIVPQLKKVLEHARTSDVLVVHCITSTLPRGLSDSPAWLDQRTRSKYATDKMCIEGSWGEEILPELAPDKGEIVVKKYRYSCFEGTPLDLFLRSNNIQTLVIGGCSTNTCVDSTIRYAFHHDYYVVILEDCVASFSETLHEHTLEEVEIRFGIVRNSDEVCRVWKSINRP